MKEELIMLLNELEFNKEVNKKNNLKNIVDIDYIIERITEILENN